LCLVAAAACGDDSPASPSDAANGACAMVANEISTYPGEYAGNVIGGGRDLTVSEGSCAIETGGQWYEPKGEDVIVKLSNLTPGADYVVNLTTANDLSFYITSDCPPTSGEVTGCLSFTDETFANELATFTATAATHYVVIDNSEETPPDTGVFVLDVKPSECTYATQDTDCTAAKPYCVANTCVECLGAFDCKTAAAPACATDNTCVPGPAECIGDDAADTGTSDDGPGGARTLTSDVAITGTVCATPGSEADWYKIDVTAGEGLVVNLAWSGGGDLDPEVIDANGRSVGITFWRNPEVITLTYLPAGTYYVIVRRFEEPATTDVQPYTLTVTKTAAQTCTTPTQCAAEYATQRYRGACTGGTCQFITTLGGANGSTCDSDEDCASGLCSYSLFEADAQKSACTTACTSTTDCAALGADFRCTGFATENLCLPSCASELQCGAATGNSALTAGQPWHYFTCTPATGVCGP
jgi:hypothetical protein